MLPVLPLRLHYTATRPMPIERYSGSTWRSGFGVKLRELACVTGAENCSGCALRAQCAYGMVFDTHRTDTAPAVTTRPIEQPHPYLLSPVWTTADEAAIDFTLMPPAGVHLPMLLRALRCIKPSRNFPGEWHLTAISQRVLAGDNAAVPIWVAGRAWPTPTFQVYECPAAPSAVRVSLRHPLRLRVKGQYLKPDSFTFTAMVAALTRRVQMLQELSSVPQERPDRMTLIASANALATERTDLQWQDWARYSSRQKQSIPMGGVVGTFELHGPREALAALWPLLWLGQWLHVGKGTVMGLGQYRLDALP